MPINQTYQIRKSNEMADAQQQTASTRSAANELVSYSTIISPWIQRHEAKEIHEINGMKSLIHVIS
jgi:hypothetical protein